MAEQLESLLKKIQDEAVAKAEQTAQERLAAAEKRAAAIIADAGKRAAAIVATAEAKASQFAESGKKSLEQAARDVLLFVRQNISAYFETLVRDAVPELLPLPVVQEILVRIADETRGRRQEGGVRVYVSEKDYANLVEFFMHRFREHVERGVELHPMRGIKAGFRIELNEKNVVYDFSDEVVVKMLSELINPVLEDILNKAAKR